MFETAAIIDPKNNPKFSHHVGASAFAISSMVELEIFASMVAQRYVVCPEKYLADTHTHPKTILHLIKVFVTAVRLLAVREPRNVLN